MDKRLDLKPRLILVLLLGVAAFAAPAMATNLQVLRESVFKILTTSTEPIFSEPWKKSEPSNSNGTGFYIGDGRILTNAHVVAGATYIAVLRDGDSKPVPAYVHHIAHDADLALLEVKDKDIFKRLRPLSFGGVPRLRSAVAVIGFPTGGEQLSITEGIVSRVSYRRYVHHGSASHLLVQVDSAINPGNSGGPVVQGRMVVGVAFQSFTRAENTGYIIPTPVIERFLKDVEDGRYDGHPQDGLTTMDWAMLNPSAIAFHGLGPKDGGVKIAHVAPWSAMAAILKADDILMAIDSQPIGVDAKVDFQGERVDFRTIYDLKVHGEKVSWRVVRGDQTLQLHANVEKSKIHPQAELIYAKHPRYFVWGGLVFTALSRSFLRSYGERWYKDAPLLLRYLDVYATYDKDAEGRAELIVFAKRLPDAVNAFAGENINGVVDSVDGQRILDLPQLINSLEHGEKEYAKLTFIGSNEPLVLSRADVRRVNKSINRKYRVDMDRWLKGEEVDGALTLRDFNAPDEPDELLSATEEAPRPGAAGAPQTGGGLPSAVLEVAVDTGSSVATSTATATSTGESQR